MKVKVTNHDTGAVLLTATVPPMTADDLAGFADAVAALAGRYLIADDEALMVTVH